MAAAKEDKEEWVSITAKALDNFTAPLDLAAVMSSSSVVKHLLTVIAAAHQFIKSENKCFEAMREVWGTGKCFLPGSSPV